MYAVAKLPARLGHYRVRGRVRVDRFGEILVAREEGPLGFQRDVTLRSVPRDSNATTCGELELVREARISEQLDHPAIVRVIELFTEGDRLVLAVEGAESLTLEALIARGEQLSDDACAYVLATVASALAYAHERSVIHRAVDPPAVVIGDDGTVKLTGFGVARMLESTADSALAFLDARTLMPSPEEAAGSAPTAKTDVWSLGILALRLFARADAASAVRRAAALRPPRMSSLRTDLSREVCAAVDAALQSAISCADFAKWIDRALDVDAGKRDLAERVELHFEATPALASTPRLLRTIRRQEASRRRLRGARERFDVEVDVDLVDLEEPESDPILEIVGIEELEGIEPAPRILTRRAMPALQHVRSIRPPLPPALLSAPPTPRATPSPRAASESERTSRVPAISRVPSRLLLFAALVGALSITAHHIRTFKIAPAPEQPPPQPELHGEACAPAPSRTQSVLDPEPPSVITPPARKLPSELGWVHVHSNGTVGQVFVAARAWGEPEKTIAVPCGRVYMNIARSDSKGGWHGWLNIGKLVDVPCDGTVAEILLARPR